MKPCPALWQTPSVNWNGDLTICCTDCYLKHKLGNINEIPLHKLWNGRKINELRIKHIKGESKDIPVCNECQGMAPNDPEEFQRQMLKFLAKVGRLDLGKKIK